MLFVILSSGQYYVALIDVCSSDYFMGYSQVGFASKENIWRPLALAPNPYCACAARSTLGGACQVQGLKEFGSSGYGCIDGV
jgi:hypothetical protein